MTTYGYQYSHTSLLKLVCKDYFVSLVVPLGGQSGSQGGMVVDSFSNFSSLLPIQPLLTQGDQIPESQFCPKKCNKPICFCINVLKVELNSVVELVLTDGKITKQNSFLSRYFTLIRLGYP